MEQTNTDYSESLLGSSDGKYNITEDEEMQGYPCDEPKPSTENATTHEQYTINAQCFYYFIKLSRIGLIGCNKNTIRVILMFMLTVVSTVLYIYLTAQLGVLTDYIAFSDVDNIKKLMQIVVIICCAVIPMTVLKKYLAELIQLDWRTSLTLHMKDKLLMNNKKILYKLCCLDTRIDNFDERISDSIRLFTRGGVSCILGGFMVSSSIIDAILLLVVGVIYLLQSDVPYSLPILLAYNILSFFIMRYYMGPVSQWEFFQNKVEAQYRLDNALACMYAETIAFYHSELREKEGNMKSFKDLYNNKSILINKIFKQNGFTILFASISSIFPYVVLILFLTLDILPEEVYTPGYVLSLGAIQKSAMDAFTTILVSFSSLAPTAGECHRLGEMIDVLSDIDNLSNIDECNISRDNIKSDDFIIESIDVILPSLISKVHPEEKKILIKNLTFTLKSGQHILITGPAGCGKSSILRVIAGLWPLANNNGIIHTPKGNKKHSKGIFFVPQKSYLTEGTLKAQILYPDEDGTQTCSDRSLEEILFIVDLGLLVERWGLNDKQDWSKLLSGGEQQRLGIARLLYHNPLYAFMDESTSALDVPCELKCINAVKSFGISMISVGHRDTLIPMHTHKLLVDLNGTYKITEIIEKEEKEVKIENNDNEINENEIKDNILYNDFNHEFSDISNELERNRRMKTINNEYNDDNNDLIKGDNPETLLISDTEAIVKNENSKQGLNRLFFTRLSYLISFKGKNSTKQLLIIFICLFIQAMGVSTIAVFIGIIAEAIAYNKKTKCLLYISIVLCMSFITALTSAYSYRIGQQFMLDWRENLTNKLLNITYEKKLLYYVTCLDKRVPDIDQRIVSDVRNLSTILESFLFSGSGLFYVCILAPILTIRAISYSLSVVGYYYLFLILSLLILPFTMTSVAKSTNVREIQEGKFREILVKLRSYCESITFYKGEIREYNGLVNSFTLLYKSWQSWIISYSIMQTVVQTSLLGASFFSVIVIAIEVVNYGYVDLDNNEEPLYSYEALIALQGLMLTLGQASCMLILQTGNIGEIIGYVNRISEAIDVMYDMSKKMEIATTSSKEEDIIDDNLLYINNVDIITPDKSKELFKNITFQVEPGNDLIIMGPSGSGKSSLLRIMSGLWPLNYNAKTNVPKDSMFIPQQLYTPYGTLRDQIIYPLINHEQDDDDDEIIKHILRTVRLGHLLEEWGLDHTPIGVPWSSMLSGGQQQALNFARLFYHRPKYVFMDESTSALDMSLEKLLLTMVKDECITMISVAHRTSVIKYHKQMLQLIPHIKGAIGEWKITEIIQ